MDLATISERITNILTEQLGVDEDEIRPDAGLMMTLGADELDLVEILMALEEEFNIVLEEDDKYRGFLKGDEECDYSVGELVGLVVSHLPIPEEERKKLLRSINYGF